MLPGGRLITQLAENPLKRGYGFALVGFVNASQLLSACKSSSFAVHSSHQPYASVFSVT